MESNLSKRSWLSKSSKAIESVQDEQNPIDEARSAPRSDRFTQTRQGWYVKTREVADLGPYSSVSAAKKALSGYIAALSKLPKRLQSTEFKLGMSVHDAATCQKRQCVECIDAEEQAAKFRSSIGS